MEYLSKFAFLLVACFDKDVNANSLHNVKDIFVFTSIRSNLLFTTIPMKVENENLIEYLHQGQSHLSMCDTVNETIVADIGEDS